MGTTNAGDAMRRLRRAAAEAPILDVETEREYLRQIQQDGDARALNLLLASHIRLVLSIARSFMRHGVPLEDLVAEGNLGLVEAVRRFDLSRGTRFSTYAAWWIRALIGRFTMANRRIVRVPRTRAARRLLSSMRTTERRLAAELGQPPTREQIAAALDVKVEDVAVVEAVLSGRDVSLAPAADGYAFELPSTLATPEEEASAREAAMINRQYVSEALDRLEDRERMIIQKRLLEDDRETLAHIGRRLGLSRERVRQLEARACKKLREALFERVA